MVFASHYTIYKQGTAQIVDWLGKTAARCGYDAFFAAQPSEKSPQKRGIKSPIKRTQKAGQYGAQIHRPARYIISTRDLPVLASFISAHSERISPDFLKASLPRILEVLADVISRRTQMTKEFGLPDPSKESPGDFVTLLEEVHEILGGLFWQLSNGEFSAEAEECDVAQSVNERALSNIFAVLRIGEPKAQEWAPEHPFQAATYELEEEEDAESVCFRIYCFLKDFAERRDQIGRMWFHYRAGDVDLPAVAVTTNVYIEMLQHAESELLVSLPKKFSNFNLSSYGKIGRVFLYAVAHSRGIDPDFRQQRGDVINMELEDVAEFTCEGVIVLLRSFLPGLVGDDLPVVKEGKFGELDVNRMPIWNWRARFSQDKIVLSEFLPEFCIFKKLALRIPVMDELSKGIVEMTRTKEIPMWLVLGCQIYLDIFEIMSDEISIAHKQLQRAGLHISTTVQSYTEFWKGMEMSKLQGQSNKSLRMIKQEVDLWVNEDFLGHAHRKNGVPESSIRPYSLLSQQPILCGLMLFRLNMRLQQAGTKLVNASGSLPAVLHLYNAVKHEAPEDRFHSWEDLEAIIRIQGRDRVFAGNVPETKDEYLEQFLLAMGYNTSQFSPSQRKGRYQTPAPKRGLRIITGTSAVAEAFWAQHCDNAKQSNAATFHKVEDLLCKSPAAAQGGDKSETPQLLLTTSSVLSSLQTCIQNDILALNIDYLALHIRCVDLLGNIHVKLDFDFVKYFDFGYLEKDTQLPLLVGFLFMIVDGSARPSESLKLSQRNVASREILLKAADLIRELAEKEGSEELDRVTRLCLIARKIVDRCKVSFLA